MRNQGLGSWPARRARMTPDAVAVQHGDRTLTYAELHRRVTRLAHGLGASGVRTGDRVAYLGPNHPVYLEVLFACGLLGAVFVPVNSRLAPSEVDYVLRDSGAALLIHTSAHAAHESVRSVEVGPEYEELLAGQGEAPDLPVSLDDVCLIMYTSGSTGKPKGAMLTHGNLTWNSVNVIVETDLSGAERALVAAPLFHTAALGMICLPTLLKGGRVLLHSSFDPAAVLADIERERVTLMFGVPTMYDALAAQPGWDTADLSSVRTLLCGGAPVPTTTIRRYLERGLSFVQGYGMTETSPGALVLDPAHVTSKIGSAGVPSFFTDVRVVSESGSPVPPGERGEIVVSGPNVLRGYWGRPEATAEVLRDGWFHSGDVATVDEDGYVYVVDRLKDVIISGGENIYPAEVENEIHAYPGVESCAVIGVPDPKWGEVGKAIVMAKDVAADDLLAHLRQRLAGYKVPKSVEFVEELPRTGSGKIQKTELRARYR
ncbi:long-chain fatty acid--CoA ligase [Amycolatopsis acidicola]|uniref:Long-chain fatty acid--CoA ligase n=1 Tax=Amycolatopsis acidicola TaxID=2596893 RepID=A0A5N0UV42_9PSEU|nr:long-chain fatty acid--CoA ligase [Amycolatopsis acidicola]KAA9156675.1 long-chain fatty acid--CoA ligase [Amycolatopsis acidicola]